MTKSKPRSRQRRASLRTPLRDLNLPQFPIVGVGASAGGLEAFMEMFRELPPDTGMAFVLIQHLSPQHLSMLSQLVQKGTQMVVEEAREGSIVAPPASIFPPTNILRSLDALSGA